MELVTAKKRIAELDNFIKKLYEGNASGKIPDRQFEKLMAQYDTEQQELEARVAEIEAKISETPARGRKRRNVCPTGKAIP